MLTNTSNNFQNKFTKCGFNVSQRRYNTNNMKFNSVFLNNYEVIITKHSIMKTVLEINQRTQYMRIGREGNKYKDKKENNS